MAEPSAKTKWGQNTSKEPVCCYYCETEVRKDNLERHITNSHKGKPVKYKRIQIPGQLSLENSFRKLVKPQPSASATKPQEENEESESESSSSSSSKYHCIFCMA